jgi:hypothetical protein
MPLNPKRKPAFRRAAKPEVNEESATVYEDDALARARRLCARGKFAEARGLLESVVAEEPDNATGRKLLLKAFVGLRLPMEAAIQADWVLGHLVRDGQEPTLCDVYARLIRSKLDLPWKQATLVAVALAGERAGKGGVVIDAANRLLKLFPASRALPAILLAAAQRQEAKGRKDLARKTFRHIVAAYPKHVEAVRARQHLERIGGSRSTRATTVHDIKG